MTTCRRCKRPLRSPASIARQMGASCAARERAEKRDAAIELAIVGWSDRQKEDAKALIKAGRLAPSKRRGLYEITGNDKVTVYLTSALSCGCSASQHLRLCYHRCAAAIADAWIAFAGAYREVA